MRALAPAALFIATPAVAQTIDHPMIEVSDKAEATHDPAETRESGHQLLVVPIPQSNPTLGTGITLVGALFYNPNHSPEPWISGVGAMYTSNGSWGVAAVHKMALASDRFRITAFGGYADVNMNFYGVGPNAGDRDRSIELNERGYAVMLQGQIRIAPHLYAGARAQLLDLDTSINRENPLFPDAEIPRPQFNTRLVQVGPLVSYDTRDHSLNPQSGAFVSGGWMFSVHALGGDFSHDKLSIAGNIYRTVRPGTVLAARVAMCRVSDGAPFYDLCLYGASSDLRGYETGRYRDRASWAVQYEIRQHLFGRFGATLFAGAGGTAPSFGRIDETRFLPAAGIGLRYMPLRRAGVNLRLDYAVGRDSQALYFSIGEAF